VKDVAQDMAQDVAQDVSGAAEDGIVNVLILLIAILHGGVVLCSNTAKAGKSSSKAPG